MNCFESALLGSFFLSCQQFHLRRVQQVRQIGVWPQRHQGLLRQVHGLTQFFSVDLDPDFPDTLLNLLPYLQLLLLDFGLLIEVLKFPVRGESLEGRFENTHGVVETPCFEKCFRLREFLFEKRFPVDVSLLAGRKLCQTNQVSVGRKLGQKLLRPRDDLDILLFAHQGLQSV